MRLLSLALILLAFSSCETYQYVTLASPEVPKNDKNDFSWENDTMRLTYNFHGEGGPVSLTVFNKMDKPLFVNWKKSALIRDGQAVSLYNSNVQISGGYSGISYGRHIQANTGSLAASFDLPEGMDLVPPGSYVTKSLQAVVQPSPVYSPKFMEKTPKQSVVSYTASTYTYTRYSFDSFNSPLHFKSYLTFELGNNPQEFSVMHSFYAQEVMLSAEVPLYFGFYKPEGDKLFIRKTGQ